MNYLNAKRRVEGLGFEFNKYAFNQVRFHNSNETPKHYFCKAIFCKVLKDMGISFFTEFEFPTKAEADVYVVDRHKVFEFETKRCPLTKQKKESQYKRWGMDLHIIYTDSVPDNPIEAYKYFLATYI